MHVDIHDIPIFKCNNIRTYDDEETEQKIEVNIIEFIIFQVHPELQFFAKRQFNQF